MQRQCCSQVSPHTQGKGSRRCGFQLLAAPGTRGGLQGGPWGIPVLHTGTTGNTELSVVSCPRGHLVLMPWEG